MLVILGLMAVLIGFKRASCPENTTAFTPVADLLDTTFHGFVGGLYPNGNRIPEKHFAKGSQHAAQILSRDTAGVPDAEGKIGMLILGYSTAAMTGRTFKEMYALMHPESPLQIIIGAQGGRDINSMTDVQSDYWDSVRLSVRSAGLSVEQIQCIWISTGDILSYQMNFPEQASQQINKYSMVLQNIRSLFPRVEIVFASDRTYAGYIGAGDPPGPPELAEPSAYYHSWTVKWVIEKCMRAEEGFLPTEVPFTDWGPTLWTNGTAGDKTGYVWDCLDAGKGGIHPTSKGRMKEAARTYHYFAAHPYMQQWFK